MKDRNILYEIKKEADKRSNPSYADSDGDDIRKENQRLRTQLRASETKVIRLNSRIEELQREIKIHTSQTRSGFRSEETSGGRAVSGLLDTPMVIENQQLKQLNQVITKENVELNGKSNRVEAELRQLRSEKYQLELRVKELNILEKMRQERFQDEVDRLTPIVIEEPAHFSQIKKSLVQLNTFLRGRIVEITENVFLISAKECEKNKKTNSFTIFRNYWADLVQQKANGFAAVLCSFDVSSKAVKQIEEDFEELDCEHEDLRGTVNEWVLHSLVEIKHTVAKQEERNLFRMLGLKYRCKYPMKGELHELDPRVMTHLQNSICHEALKLIHPKFKTDQK